MSNFKPVPMTGDQLSPLSSAFTELAVVPTDLTFPVTTVIKNQQTGELVVDSQPDGPYLGPTQLLSTLRRIGSYRAENPELTTDNVHIVAHLGAVATKRLAAIPWEDLPDILSSIQRDLRAVGQGLSIAFISSNLPREKTGKTLTTINSIVNANPRLKGKGR
ncbi:MAG TPA: hypothetical protein VEH48_01455 [Candidatus Nitrosopolaris sp.]|nr:hypothetical protein [Candidatus Nitrosopolaris sp.]